MRSSVQLRPFQAQQSLCKSAILRRNITRTCIVAFQQIPKPSYERPSSLGPVVARVLGATAAAIIIATAPASFAELQTVPPDQVTSLAKPLKVQTVNKNRIWLLFVLGASSLFGITVVAENNESWFPAISKANKALAASTAAAKERARKAEEEQLQLEERLAEVKQETTTDSRLESAVAEGLLQARRPPPALTPPIDVEVEEESASTASIVAAAAVEDAEISEASRFPAELGIEEEEENEEEVPIIEEEAVDEMDVVETAAAGASRAAPLFEISGDEIEASAKSFQQREVLNEISIEDLQRELEERKKTSASNNGSTSENN
ncbi:hypothetical protein Ndes2526B_g01848 [Nannochloris sp. 'desiccata']